VAGEEGEELGAGRRVEGGELLAAQGAGAAVTLEAEDQVGAGGAGLVAPEVDVVRLAVPGAEDLVAPPGRVARDRAEAAAQGAGVDGVELGDVETRRSNMVAQPRRP
jgi:hypothetical protein